MSFTLDLTRFAEKAKGRMDLVVRKTTLDILARVVTKSPVDTGRFRGNWNTGLDAPVLAERRPAKAGGAPLERGAEVLGAYSPGRLIYVTNSLPYAEALENGSSQQAPTGIVATTLREYPGIVERAVNETKRERP